MKIVLCETGRVTNVGYRFEIYFVSYDTANGYDAPSELRQRPVLKDLWRMDGWKRYINEEIHNWLISYEIKYSLFMDLKYPNTPKEIREWGIVIPDINKALLFKLTWCGK